MKKIYYLKTCSTCQRILSDLPNINQFELQNIKELPLTAPQLKELKDLVGTYEALFSKRAQLYKKLDLKNKNLKEADYKKYLLEHYTFLKRPVIIIEDEVFIGNSKKIIEAAKSKLHD